MRRPTLSHAFTACFWLLAVTLLFARADAATIYVDDSAAGLNNGTTWIDAYTKLQDALLAAVSGDEIWVVAGLYLPDAGGGAIPGDRGASFQLKTGVGLYGGFLGSEITLSARAGLFETTILSGDLNGDDLTVGMLENSLHVVRSGGTAASAVLDGFRITAGNADQTGADDAGGLLNESGSPTVRNCIFDKNQCKDDGAAVTSTGTSAPAFIQCLFHANYCGDVGGAIWSSGSSASLSLVNCAFIGNDSGRLGGAIYQFAPGAPVSVIVGCVFSGNTAVDRGGAMFVSSATSPPHLIACTLSGNTAQNQVGGVYNSTSTQVSGCILWGNTDASGTGQGAQLYGPLAGIGYSCVQGWNGSLGGIGNIGLNPQLSDPDGADNLVGTLDDNVALAAGSPCYDAGDNVAIPADQFDVDLDANVTEPLPLDLAGNARFQDDVMPDTGNGTPPIVDMGALEGPAGLAIISYGQGCAGSGGFTPALHLNGTPAPGGTLTLVIDKGLGGSLSLLLFGLQQAAFPVGNGCFLNVNPVLPVLLFIPLGGSGPGTGTATLIGAVPAGTSGAVVTMQVFVHEPSLPGQYSNSNGVQLTIQ